SCPPVEDVCESHGDPLHLWCRECQRALCGMCLYDGHITSTHTIIKVHMTVQEKKKIIEQQTMETLEYDYLSVLPPEILHYIFLNLKSQEILLNIELVCKAWFNIVNQTQFWIQRLNYLGFSLCKNVRRELLSFGDDEELLRCLKATCYHIEMSQMQNAHASKYI
ncbi:unnamed protein product, partial [Meganyctiphanes norvegica]